MLARQLSRALGAARGEGAVDRYVLALVGLVQLVDRFVARRPDGRARERAPRALGHLLDIGQVGDPVDDVMEAVVRLHPLDGERAPVFPGLPGAQRTGQSREA